VAGWEELIVGLYVMQRHGVSSKAYIGCNVGPLLYLTNLDVKYHRLGMENERSLNHGNVGPLLYLTKLDVNYHHLGMENEHSLNHGLVDLALLHIT
jgi:hypothetical protein